MSKTEFSGSFTTSEKLQAFLDPLKNLASLMGEEGIILNGLKDDKTIHIYAQNTSSGILGHIKYKKELFDGFDFANDIKVGVLKISDFVKYFSVIDENGVNLEFNDNTFAISHETGSLTFRTADPSMITEAPKTFKGTSWFAEVELDKRFAKLKKAMSVLANEDAVYVIGDDAKNKIKFQVRSSSVELNTYKIEFDAPISQEFETPYRKDIWQLVLGSTSEIIKASFGQKLVKFEIKDEFCESTYFVAKKSN